MAVKLGLVGTGTVGGGCIDILKNHAEGFKRHYDIDVELVRVCSRNPEQAITHGVEDLFTQDYRDILDDPDIDIVIELIGGTTVARDVVCGALRAGKNVVTANKALMATYGEEVMGLADEMGKEIAFEASVGGGIPIIDPLKHSLIANRIDTVMGIVNGTTNYMLTRMAEDGLAYDEALAEAQAKGFAEADPTADVDGLDAAAKIAILASIAFNSRVTIGDVHAEGIRNITPLDLDTARDMGYCVKLLAHAHRTDEGVDVRVHPTMLPLNHQLSTVNGVFNAIYVVGDAVGETMFFGEGAGAGPAASAVMGDVLEVARHIQQGVGPLVGCTCTDKLSLVPMDNLKTKYYIRFAVADRSGVLAAMAQVFANHNVSVYSVVQRGKQDGNTVNITYVTHLAREKSVRAVLADIAELDDVLREEPSVIRVEE
ncbi:MAG: homoserine dehydrogenase [Gordonibacter sp.]|uniref:homoserine dehydrogenase n=1 Tax=Gordonibacter sp. TaxID=1968902 RepID=UPI002FC7B96D